MPANENATKLAQLINPQVLADMISAELPNAITLYPLATVGTKLKGRPGNTLTLPKFGYIGDATDVAEGADIPLSKMSTSTASVTIKKAGRGVELSDESVLSGYGDTVNEAKNQLKMCVANKVDNDLFTDLRSASLTHSTQAGNKITVADVVTAKAKFGEQVKEKAVLFVNSKHYTDLVLDSKWIPTDKGVDILMDGVVGSIGGCQVVVTDKLADTEAFIVRPGALGIEMKREVEIESDRDIVAKSTVITVDQHYGTYLKDESKAVKISITA